MAKVITTSMCPSCNTGSANVFLRMIKGLPGNTDVFYYCFKCKDVFVATPEYWGSIVDFRLERREEWKEFHQDHPKKKKERQRHGQ